MDELEANTTGRAEAWKSILDNSGATLVVIGDGTGTGAGSKKYEDGKLYTVVVSGANGSLNQDQK